MTQVIAPETARSSWPAFLRNWLIGSGLLLGLTVVSQVIASRGDDDKETRDGWLNDVLFVLVASLLFGGIALLVARRALNGDAQRQDRSVIGLGVFTVVLAVVGWFTAAPYLAALATIGVSRQTGAADRSKGARIATVLSVVVIAGVFVFTWSTLIAEDLL